MFSMIQKLVEPGKIIRCVLRVHDSLRLERALIRLEAVWR